MPLPPPAHRDDQVFGEHWLLGLQGGQAVLCAQQQGPVCWMAQAQR